MEAREEISRTLLDLIPENRSRRLAIGRELLARAADLVGLGVEPCGNRRPIDRAGVPRRRRRRTGRPQGSKPGRASPAERRLAARALLETWTAVARDLAVVAAGGRERAVDLALVDDLETAAALLPAGAAAAFLARLARAAELLEANANPELIVDVLVLAWPRRRDRARRRATAPAGHDVTPAAEDGGPATGPRPSASRRRSSGPSRASGFAGS